MATGFPVKVVEKLIAPRRERADKHSDLATGRNDFLPVQGSAFELGCSVLLVADEELHLHSGRYRYLTWNKLVIAQHNRDRSPLRQSGSRIGQHQEGGKGEKTHCRRSCN